MADSHASHASHDDSKGHHAPHAPPEEDPLRTPGWMPLLGMGLLLAGALWMYLYVSPGVWSPADADGGADAGATAAP
jgi:hypothetical protein